MTSPTTLRSRPNTLSQAGHQRLWYWRGWRVRYWFATPPEANADATPIVLIHGFGANLNQWRHNLPELSQSAPVYALDLLGFGDTEKAATLYGADLWASQVGDFIQAVVGQPVVLVGHSLGALVALTVSHSHPALVRKLAMITVPLQASREDLVAGWVDVLARRVESMVANPLLIRLILSIFRRPGTLRRALGGIYLVADRVDEELVETFAVPPCDRGAPRTLCYLVKSRTEPNFSPSVKTMLAELDLPTLLIWGQQDRVIPVKMAKDLAVLSPNIELQTLPGVGHCLYDEQPETFNRLLLDWVRAEHLL
jgi:pimeloyl-ACP methyl ester carboxylesterase